MPPRITLVPGSVRKICQLTGEQDRERQTPAFNRTETRFGLYGTDLGSSFEHGGRLWFLFGDTWPGPGPTNHFDSVAWTTDTVPEPGIHLEFVNDNGKYRSPTLSGPPGVHLTKVEFEVPIAGLSANGQMYVFHSTDHFMERGNHYMGRTVLMKARNGDPTDLHWLYDMSVLGRGGRFLNVACTTSGTTVPGLPFAGPALLAWGSGRYRESHVYFGCAPLASVEDRSSWRFFAGVEAGSQRPLWTDLEAAATALFLHPQVGELSASWIAPLGLWLLLYNAGSPRGINGRVAASPWGPWSAPMLVFDPGWPGLGYGHFMHVANGTDPMSDPGRGHEGGGEYGPYLIDRYTRPADLQRGARVYFVLSTWNPYNTVLMAATLSREEDRPTLGGVPSMVIAGLGQQGRNLEVALPRTGGGLLHLARSADTWPPPWGPVHLAGSETGRTDADRPPLDFVSMAAVAVGSTTGLLHVAATTNGTVVTWWRERETTWAWHGPFPVVADGGYPLVPAVGSPALIQSRHGARRQNLELVVPHRDRGIHHVWWDADLTIPCWRPAPLFARELEHVDALTLTQSSFGDPGNLELLARTGDRLWFFWRQPEGGGHKWNGPFPLVADGTPVTGVAGVPSVIQGGYGAQGKNFELATPLASGGIALLWRDNDPPNPAQWAWHRHVIVDAGHRYDGVSLLQGPFGEKPGNLEMVASGAAGLVHFWRDAVTKQWSGPFPIPLA
jgi:hypothetical protein